ncbi:DUF1508 domain-containing protein [Pseudarthrobacter psychrotolerans]|uniref:DUF1508 domain-containing protein n=1 Tax=Pseudarthrobacter psychrotolerans TaxID=2697569 RepID=A0A6P1NV93_9MICC|nr:DUF1508 domain-containing protein [Pseudarthrobacter psychrotolerans]QHK22300.1 DUF1508 domain-containing protein [Pseudarthrobacter psychrotolerans]
MAGRFEIHRVSDECYRLRLTDSNGNTVAVSPDFKHLGALKDGINALRENAATGVVVDLRQQPLTSG